MRMDGHDEANWRLLRWCERNCNWHQKHHFANPHFTASTVKWIKIFLLDFDTTLYIIGKAITSFRWLGFQPAAPRKSGKTDWRFGGSCSLFLHSRRWSHRKLLCRIHHWLLLPYDAAHRRKHEKDCSPQVRGFCCVQNVLICPVPLHLNIIICFGKCDRKWVTITQAQNMFCSNYY